MALTRFPRDTFDLIILLGRPASGKSEIISFLENTPLVIRRRKFHLAELEVIDDFPMLWTWFEEDKILSLKLGKPRLYTDEQGYFKHKYFWHLLVERLSLEYSKRVRDEPNLHAYKTVVIEFSRGSEHGGYREAFEHLSDEVLQRAAVVYVAVSFDEALRKNRRRFNPERPDGILEHALPDEKMERLYREDDWFDFSSKDPQYLDVRSLRLPYAVFENEDDVTTDRPEQLSARLERVLGELWSRYP